MKKLLPSLRTAVIGWILFQIVGVLADLPFHFSVRSYPWNGPFGAMMGTFAVLVFYRWLRRPDFRGMLLDGESAEGMRLTVLFWLYLLLVVLADCLVFRTPYTAPTLNSVSISFVAGFGEELCFRGLFLSELMRHRPRPEDLVPAALSSALFFGLLHAANVLMGADLASTAFQTASSFLIGFFWAALFLRCGSLWPCILTHLVTDVVAMLAVSQSDGILTGGIDAPAVLDAVLRLGLCAVGVWLLRPEKREEMVSLWAKKWRQT